MAQKWNEKWEQTKSHLVRSMFEDVPRLTPISETNEPVPDILTPADSPTRPYSPLPELIIEREKNLHDETDEFYQMLEEKMIKLYKKLFLEEDFESDADTSVETYKLIEYEREAGEENYMSIEHNEQSMCSDEATQSDLDRDSLSSNTDITDTSNLNDMDVVHEECVESQDSNETDEEQSLISHTYEVIVTKANVHRELAPDDSEDINNNLITEQRVISPTFSQRSLILVPRKKLDILSKKMGEQPILTDSVGLVDTQAKTDRDVLENVEEENREGGEEEQIEAMRLGAAKIRSIGSITGEQISKDSLTPTTVVEKDMSLIQNVGTPPEMNSTSDSSEDPYSLVEISRDSNYLRKRTSPNVSSNKESPIKRKRYETKAVQTSNTCNEEMIWEGVRDNFFCGTPLIYKLCRCRDHECV